MSKCIFEVFTAQRIYYLLRNFGQKLSTLTSCHTALKLILLWLHRCVRLEKGTSHSYWMGQDFFHVLIWTGRPLRSQYWQAAHVACLQLQFPQPKIFLLKRWNSVKHCIANVTVGQTRWRSVYSKVERCQHKTQSHTYTHDMKAKKVLLLFPEIIRFMTSYLSLDLDLTKELRTIHNSVTL